MRVREEWASVVPIPWPRRASARIGVGNRGTRRGTLPVEVWPDCHSALRPCGSRAVTPPSRRRRILNGGGRSRGPKRRAETFLLNEVHLMKLGIPIIGPKGGDPASRKIPSGGYRRVRAMSYRPLGTTRGRRILRDYAGRCGEPPRRIEGGFWDRLRRWLPTPQDPGPDPKPLPTPWRRAPDSRLRKPPGDRRSGLPA